MSLRTLSCTWLKILYRIKFHVYQIITLVKNNNKVVEKK